jgi:ferredoxin, 2Fe-2S
MVKIVIENWRQKELAFTDLTKTALSHFLESGLDWMHACGGKGRCTTCRIEVLEGGEMLSGLTRAEQKYRQTGALKPNERLSCQAAVRGSIQIRIPEDCKLPHIKYSPT